jgi:hypothetical protein
MHHQSERIVARYASLHDQHGLATAIDYLEGIKKEMAEIQKDVDQMLRSAQNEAVTLGLGRFVENPPSERAPSKEKFIELFGIETFNQVKTLARGRRVFVWNGKEV